MICERGGGGLSFLAYLHSDGKSWDSIPNRCVPSADGVSNNTCHLALESIQELQDAACCLCKPASISCQH